MNPTAPLQRAGRPMQPHKWWYYEMIPLAGRNAIIGQQRLPTKSSCPEELQALFLCLKKWEFDDLPCTRQRDDFNACITREDKKFMEKKKAQSDAPVSHTDPSQETHPQQAQKSATTTTKSLSVTQLNKLMAQYPQPDLGKFPYHAHKRLPSQPYYEDQFNSKHWKGKKY